MKIFFVKGLIFLAIVFLGIKLAHSAEWRLIFKTNKADLYIDQSSISNAGTEKTILIKNNEVQGERSPSSLELRYLVNCSSGKVALVAAKQYKGLDLQGENSILTVSNPPQWVEAKDGSAGGAYVKAVCSQTQSLAPSPQPLSQVEKVPAPSIKIVNPVLSYSGSIINMRELSCKPYLVFVEKPGGQRVDIGAQNAKPFQLAVSGNVLKSYYPQSHGPKVSFDGAIFQKTIKTSLEGAQLTGFVFTKNNSDGTREITKIYDKSPIILETEYSGGGSSNLVVSFANCQ